MSIATVMIRRSKQSSTIGIGRTVVLPVVVISPTPGHGADSVIHHVRPVNTDHKWLYSITSSNPFQLLSFDLQQRVWMSLAARGGRQLLPGRCGYPAFPGLRGYDNRFQMDWSVLQLFVWSGAVYGGENYCRRRMQDWLCHIRNRDGSACAAHRVDGDSFSIFVSPVNILTYSTCGTRSNTLPSPTPS